MRKFVFKLEPVLQQRQRQEELAQKDFALALAEVGRVQDKIVGKQNELEKCLSVGVGETGQKLDVDRLIDNRRYIENIYLEMEALYQELQEKEEVARHRQHFLVMAAKDKESMSKFKEKKQQTWLREALSEEQKLLDEVGLQMSARSKL
jgi:flagellar FliJ protein